VCVPLLWARVLTPRPAGPPPPPPPPPGGGGGGGCVCAAALPRPPQRIRDTHVAQQMWCEGWCEGLARVGRVCKP